ALVAEWFKGRPSEYLFLSVYFVLLLLFMLSPQIMLVVASKRRLKATCIVILATVFFFITVTGTLIAATPEELASPSFTLLFFLISSGVIAAMLAIAPANSLFKRLVFLALGLVLLIALNTLSHYAPDIREWLKPPVMSWGQWGSASKSATFSAEARAWCPS